MDINGTYIAQFLNLMLIIPLFLWVVIKLWKLVIKEFK